MPLLVPPLRSASLTRTISIGCCLPPAWAWRWWRLRVCSEWQCPMTRKWQRLTICVERRFPLPQTPRQRPCLRAGCVWLLLMLNFLRLPPALYYCFMFTLKAYYINLLLPNFLIIKWFIYGRFLCWWWCSLVVPAAYFQLITQAGTRKAPQCGGQSRFWIKVSGCSLRMR